MGTMNNRLKILKKRRINGDIATSWRNYSPTVGIINASSASTGGRVRHPGLNGADGFPVGYGGRGRSTTTDKHSRGQMNESKSRRAAFHLRLGVAQFNDIRQNVISRV